MGPLQTLYGRISIHALCEEGDGIHAKRRNKKHRFLSTPSARRATSQQKFNRRSVYISIHALCEEGDHWTVGTMVTTTRFLSTPSARRATKKHGNKRRDIQYFYPRPLRGGRLFC